MRLQFDDGMRERLRQRRQEQLADVRAGRLLTAEDLLLEDEVIRVRCGFGNASFLGLDGRAIFWNYGGPSAPEVLTDVASVACVVAWAAEDGLPELLECLPKMPSSGVICRECGGSRWLPMSAGTREDGGPQVCPLCHGLGWTLA